MSRRRFIATAGVTAAGVTAMADRGGDGTAATAGDAGVQGASWTAWADRTPRSPPATEAEEPPAAESDTEPSGEPSADGDSPAENPPGEESQQTEAENAESDEEEDETASVTTVLGANLNGRPSALADDMHLIDHSNTQWVRAFVDVREKLANGVHPRNDPDVVALRQVARRKGCSLIVSLKWDFRGTWGTKEPERVPARGSARQRELFQAATRHLRHIGAPLDVVVLGNEPMWETLPADIKPENPAIVRFTRDLKDHLVRHGDHGDPQYLVGALNRTFDDETREVEFGHFHRGLYQFVREDDDVDGVDLHVHYDAFADAERMVALVREAVPDATITVTEFSPVWRYNRIKRSSLSTFRGGTQASATAGLAPDATVAEFVQRAKAGHVPPQDLAVLYERAPWFNDNHVDDAYELFAAHDVRIAMLGFLHTEEMRAEDWTRGWAPFHLNFLYQPALAAPEVPVEETAVSRYLEDYRAYAL